MLKRLWDEFTRALGWLFPPNGDSDGEETGAHLWQTVLDNPDVYGPPYINELWDSDASDEDDAADIDTGWLDD